MNIKTVTVDIHEKRNHPHGEYSHYDARVSLTAELLEGEDATNAIDTLQFVARQHVALECDRWVAAIEHEKLVGESKHHLQRIINLAQNGDLKPQDADKFELHLIPLAEGERIAFNIKMVEAQEKGFAIIRQRLERHIRDAKDGYFPDYQKDFFNNELIGLPEAERQQWIDRLEAAQASQVEAEPDPEEIPY